MPDYHVVLVLDQRPNASDTGWTYTATDPPAEGAVIEVTKADSRARARVATHIDGLKFSATELERLT